jgi:hypothetical protein
MADELTYTKGFNAGYKLQKYSPELFEMLKDSLGQENEYNRGLKEGAAQADKEKEQQRMQELESIQNDQSKEQDLER